MPKTSRHKNHINCIIIGAGVIGLSLARKLSIQGFETLILEKEKSFGMGISSRNSEVIHAGIYFDPEMLKTSLCVSGKMKLYDYTKSHHIPHNNCGKLIAATTNDEVEKLEQIKKNAKNCGVNDLKLLTQNECQTLEPDIKAVAGLFSPSSGVIDTHSYMLSLLGDAEKHGANVAYNVDIKNIHQDNDTFTIQTETDGEEFDISCDLLINAAGLGAMQVAKLIRELDHKYIPELIMAKGHYFTYTGKTNFKHLVYPIPILGGLGIHLTLDMAGGVKFGPDVIFTEHEEYGVNPSLKEKFIHNISTYFPSLNPDKLNTDYAGIRPKLSKKGEDFNIQFSDTHGIKGLINLFGIESPGLTSSLAIADYIVQKI